MNKFKQKYAKPLIITLVVITLLTIICSIQLINVTQNILERYVSNSRVIAVFLDKAISNHNEDELTLLIYHLNEAKAYTRSNFDIAYSGFYSGVIFEPISHEAALLTYDTMVAIEAALAEFYESGEICSDAMQQVVTIHAEQNHFLDEVGITEARTFFTLIRSLSSYSRPS